MKIRKSQIRIISIVLYIIGGLLILSTLGDFADFFGNFDLDLIYYIEHNVYKLIIAVICIGAGVFINKYCQYMD